MDRRVGIRPPPWNQLTMNRAGSSRAHAARLGVCGISCMPMDPCWPPLTGCVRAGFSRVSGRELSRSLSLICPWCLQREERQQNTMPTRVSATSVFQDCELAAAADGRRPCWIVPLIQVHRRGQRSIPSTGAKAAEHEQPVTTRRPRRGQGLRRMGIPVHVG